ncbi:unnamed protein product [Candidula unifasciata]|uniref:Ubiquitin-like domain-containing protein n=1 Tax=Candidula unifasciata TaxID=100452 RepID=A0A8S3YWW9_9EUPU|nr:unnamed protein product [Candidula unifasciata]
MLIFGVYKRQRIELEVPVEMTVRELKAVVREKLGMSEDVIKRDNKLLVLSYAGGDLEDTWVFSDLGLLPGTTLKIQLKDNIQPVLYIRCSHNQETINVFDDLTLTDGRISLVRSLASARSGLPVGIFRLTTFDHTEMFDHHSLHDYRVDRGQTILLEVWDGWSEFLNLSIMGFTPQVMALLDVDEAVARYQLKVALFVAAHFGHIDLARCVLKQGVGSDEPTGYHPARMWCQKQGHVDSLKCPVHEATLSGQVGVLRLFVNFDITCLKAKDGHGLEPLNLALRHKVKNCASFLLSKQWTRVNVTKDLTLHVATLTKIRKWCERAKERALVKYGPGKSSLKRRRFNTGSLVIHGVVLDGFSKSPMTGRSKTEVLKDKKHPGSTIDPERYFRSVLVAQDARLRQRPRKHPLRWHKSSTSSQVSKSGSRCYAFKTSNNCYTPFHCSGFKKANYIFFSSDLSFGSRRKNRRASKLKSQTVPSETASTDEIFLEEKISMASKKRKKRYRTPSAVSPRINTTRSSMQLPLGSFERSPRPFFYHQGVREDELIEAALRLVARYKGDSSRERAIKSLSLANSFSEMPWLCRVRLALNVTWRSLQRSLPVIQ